MPISTLMRCAAAAFIVVFRLAAAEHQGHVRFGGLPMPGATVTAVPAGKPDSKPLTAITGPEGLYTFPDLPDGDWTLRVEMLCFEPAEKQIPIRTGGLRTEWDLKLKPLEQIQAEAPPSLPEAAAVGVPRQVVASPKKKDAPSATPSNTPGGFQRADLKPSGNLDGEADSRANDNAAELSQRAADGFLINGSINNGASSPFALAPAFGNFRKGPASLYNASIGAILGNSIWDARPFSLTGQETPKPAYSRITGLLALGGPLKIPHLLRNGPNVTLNYQWTRNQNAITQSALMPTPAERAGDFSQSRTAAGQPLQITDPSTGMLIPGAVIPQSRLSSQAKALLALYPLPNFTAGARYNFQTPIVNATHQDSLQSRASKPLGRRDQIMGAFAYQSTRSDNSNVFGFLNTTDSSGLNTSVEWRHSLTPRFSVNLGVQFSRLSTQINSYFANRRNISGEAGITGNNQDPVNWGPPSLTFASGIAGLSDANPSLTRNQTSGFSVGSFLGRGRHGLQFGADVRRQQFNLLTQQDPRGSFTFTGAAAGSDFAGFLLGVPDTSSIAFGNADKYLRAWFNDAYFTDDWRISPGFTLNAGVRWEYGSPVTELYGRLVNLDLRPGFTAAGPVLASSPQGMLTGRAYPDSLIHPDKHGFQPRIGFSWRPLPASSLVVRGGYGVYYNTSVYQSIATQMAQQSPLSKSLTVQNSPANPLSLANGFNVSPGITPTTFAVDPDLQVGHSQNWQLSIQRDLPRAFVMTATYSGGKGTRGLQAFLPNTFPAGASNPCISCPAGFVYLASNGNSTREAVQIQLRRRLRAGATGSLQYTYSKSIDNSTPGARGFTGASVAQNWLDLNAERGLSNFDQRHALTAQIQYTTGMNLRGGFAGGWAGTLMREWTFATQITAGSGLPLTPVYLSAVRGTGVTGSLRPDYTGAPLYTAPSGFFLNPAAYVTPASGQWGNAGRNSITGPRQFVMNATLGRTFRMSDRASLEFRLDSANALNQVTYTGWNTTLGSAQFGFPISANAMRTVQTTIRARF